MTLLDARPPATAPAPAAGVHAPPAAAGRHPGAAAPRPAARLPWLLATLIVAAAVLLRGRAEPALQAWSTVVLAVVLQALPFLVLGVMVSGAVAALVPPGVLARALPRRPLFAVPAAAIGAAALPGCECSSVPVAGRLVGAGVPPAAALTFLLAAPAVNPVVVVATLVAFPGRPGVAVARVVASLVAAIAVGWLWNRWGSAVTPLAASPERPAGWGARLRLVREVALADFAQAGGYLVLGAGLAATLQVVVPRSVLGSLSGSAVVAVAALAVLAVVLAVCSEADAFVAASLTQFSLTSRLVFLVVGPMVDVKLVALQVGTFGRRFAARFAPLAFCCAVTAGIVVGAVLL